MADPETCQQEVISCALTQCGVTVMPDMPMEAVTVLNAEVLVALVVVSKSETCVARVFDGEVDFLMCAGPVDCPGGTLCGWATHETGEKDSKRRNVLKMALPDQGEVFAIPVNASRRLVKKPKIFLIPILPWVDLPYAIFNKGWDKMLTTLCLRAREWKYFLEDYPGEIWMVNSYLNRGSQA